MDEPLFSPIFRSVLAPLLDEFLGDKRSRGFSYRREASHLLQLDRFLVNAGLAEVALPKLLIEKWLSQTGQRKPSTHRKRVVVIRQLAAFLQRHGCPAYLPLLPLTPRKELRSAARIFSREEMRALFDAADHIPPNPHSPVRHLVVPELFRVLYGCGLRVGEARRLTVADVDLDSGVLRIRQGKFHRDRSVPLAPGLQYRLKQYTNALGVRAPSDPFFPAPRGRQYGHHGIYCIFRELLEHAGIVHHGRGQGPRLHEIRHTFAVHRLEAWYQAGENLNAKLPLLATYLGHQSMVGTQAYLQLTQTLFSTLTTNLDRAYGHIIPGEDRS
jgi:integrase/recombinase XerD